MSWPGVTGTSEIEALIELVRPWLHVGDIRRPAVLVDLPFGPYEFETAVTWQDGMPATARGLRAALLARAEDALEAVEAAGWFLTGYPEMRFGGRVTRPVCTFAGVLVEPAVQHSVSLRVDFAVMRL